MAEALRRWMEQPKEKEMTPLDLAPILVDAEWRHREQRKLTGRLRTARFRQDACVEDIDYQHPRGLQKSVMLDLAACRWVEAHPNVIFSGQTGVGKSYLACALGQKACREGHSVVYRRASRLFDELAQARADGSHFQLLRRLAKNDVLVIDVYSRYAVGWMLAHRESAALAERLIRETCERSPSRQASSPSTPTAAPR